MSVSRPMRESMVDRVRALLLERILNGHLAPGARLKEMELAAEFETSQGPIREALRELEAIGLVQTEPYKGSRVREFSEKELEDAYVVRASLEELATRLATPRLKGSTDGLKKLATQILQAARKGDTALYTKYDMAFHRTIVECSGNEVLLRSWDGLGFEIRTRIRLVVGGIDLIGAQEAHWQVIKAIEAGNGRAASRLLYQHVIRFASDQRKKAQP